MLALTLRYPATGLAVHDDGTLAMLGPWPVSVMMTLAWLAAADGRRLILRGDEIEIRCTNGSALYRLGPADERGLRHGELVWARR